MHDGGTQPQTAQNQAEEDDGGKCVGDSALRHRRSTKVIASIESKQRLAGDLSKHVVVSNDIAGIAIL